jgi:hypothetical protein
MIWMEKPLVDAPDAILLHWKVFEIHAGNKVTRHFIGDDIISQTPLVSSHITTFDSEGMLGITRFKRVYKLQRTEASDDIDTHTIINNWLESLGVSFDEIRVISASELLTSEQDQ